MTRAQEYQLYLKSPAWKAIRKLVIKRDGSKCVKCHSRKRLTVHHLQYPEQLGTEPLEYMQTLCEDCHNVLHGGTPRKSKNKKSKTVAKKRANRVKTDKVFATTIKLSSSVKIFSREEISQYAATL